MGKNEEAKLRLIIEQCYQILEFYQNNFHKTGYDIVKQLKSAYITDTDKLSIRGLKHIKNDLLQKVMDMSPKELFEIRKELKINEELLSYFLDKVKKMLNRIMKRGKLK